MRREKELEVSGNDVNQVFIFHLISWEDDVNFQEQSLIKKKTTLDYF